VDTPTPISTSNTHFLGVPLSAYDIFTKETQKRTNKRKIKYEKELIEENTDYRVPTQTELHKESLKEMAKKQKDSIFLQNLIKNSKK